MIIDMHTHIFGKGWLPREFFYGIARFITYEFAKSGVVQSNEEVGDGLIDASDDPRAESLLEEMEDAGIDRSILLPVDFEFAFPGQEVPMQEVNRLHAELARQHPQRLIAFAGIDPRRSNAVELFTQCVQEWGMQGLKLHPTAGFYPNQKEVYPLLDKACAWKLPVLIHSGSMMVPLRSKYSQVIHLDDLGVDFPDLTVIAAHCGGVFGYQQMISVMSTKLNMLVDISAWQLPAIKSYPFFCRALREVMDFAGSERILFGSDSPSFRSFMSNPDWVQTIKDLPRNAPEGITFTEAEIAAVLGGNAQRVMKL
jgi:predicted TIM-barrel fold metal-dependent hydrolase